MAQGAALLALTACASPGSPPGGRAARPDEIPETVTVPGGPVELGFALGKARQTMRLHPFAVSKTPITVGRYKECMAAGQCTAPEITGGACAAVRTPLVEGRTFDAQPNADGLPITCVSPRQAAEYCAWIGGALPTAEQWIYAARGASVQRYAWGPGAPDCSRNPRAIPADRDPEGCCSALAGCDPATYYGVAQRPEAASPFGMLDVLETPAELLRGSESSPLPACRSSAGACAVQGVLPGAIDFVAAVAGDIDRSTPSDPGPAYGFRCVLEVKP